MTDSPTKLPLIARTSIARFISINERVVVQISRHHAPDAYCDPPAATDLARVWGSCHREVPDSFREIGTLEDALKDSAPTPMIVAAAIASPRRFAEMVASAHDLGRVVAVGSLSIAVLADHFKDARRFCAIAVTRKSLVFHTLVPPDLFGKDRSPPGVYAVAYSLSSLRVERNEMVEPYPAPKRPKP